MATLLTPGTLSANDPQFQIGVYYFPGWNGDADQNWASIKPYNDRTPLLGWYDDNDPQIVQKQIGWMAQYGISYVAFDWYWENGAPHSAGALSAYQKIPNPNVKYAIMWANDHLGIDLPQWRNIVSYWVAHYLKQKSYITAAGRPVIFVLSQQNFTKNAMMYKLTAKDYISAAQKIAISNGILSISFVAGFDDLSYTLVEDEAPQQGYAAVSGYNFQRPPWRPQKPGWNKLTHGYRNLDVAYRQNWAEGKRSTLPVITPMTTGWDRSPWGGSGDPLHDNSIATPAEFKAHLLAAKTLMRSNTGVKTHLGIICCWNEYGEGSFIEPTRKNGFALLQAVKSVFSGR